MKKLLLMIILLFIVACTKCPECPELDCPEPKEVVKLVEKTQYVCSDKSIVDDPFDCVESQPIEEKKEKPLFVPITTNEVDSYITLVTVKPACTRYGQGGSVKYLLQMTAKKINYQVREQGTDWKTIYTQNGLFEKTTQFLVCTEIKCPYDDNPKLIDGHVYLFRLEFDMGEIIQYSNEHVIDLSEGSKYMTKIC